MSERGTETEKHKHNDVSLPYSGECDDGEVESVMPLHTVIIERSFLLALLSYYLRPVDDSRRCQDQPGNLLRPNKEK